MPRVCPQGIRLLRCAALGAGHERGNGTYAVEVTDKDVRSMRLAQFAVVETTEEADIKQPTDFELQTAALDAQVFFGGITENDVRRIVDEHLGIPKDANGKILLTTEHI